LCGIFQFTIFNTLKPYSSFSNASIFSSQFSLSVIVRSFIFSAPPDMDHRSARADISRPGPVQFRPCPARPEDQLSWTVTARIQNGYCRLCSACHAYVNSFVSHTMRENDAIRYAIFTCAKG